MKSTLYVLTFIYFGLALCFILVYNCGLTVRNKRICYVMLTRTAWLGGIKTGLNWKIKWMAERLVQEWIARSAARAWRCKQEKAVDWLRALSVPSRTKPIFITDDNYMYLARRRRAYKNQKAPTKGRTDFTSSTFWLSVHFRLDVIYLLDSGRRDKIKRKTMKHLAYDIWRRSTRHGSEKEWSPVVEESRRWMFRP